MKIYVQHSIAKNISLHQGDLKKTFLSINLKQRVNKSTSEFPFLNFVEI